MEPNINHIDESEPIDETIDIADADDAAEHRPRGRGRGRRGMRGRRQFGPNRPYRFALFVEDDGSYLLRSPDLSADAVPVASLDAVGAAMQAAITERAAEDAKAAEASAKDAEYSGKFVLRLPRSMHRQLAELAEAEGVSLNQLALAFLAQGMGQVDSEEEFGGRRGPRGGRRGPKGGYRRHGGHGPEGSHEGRSFDGRGAKGRGFGRRHWSEDRPDDHAGRWGHWRPDVATFDTEGAQLV